MRTSRVASRRARSSSCDASSTVQPLAGAAAHDLLEHLAPVLVETGVRLVEQQQARLARERVGERQPPALSLRQPTVRDVRDALQPDALERGVGVGRGVTRRPRREADVLGDGEVVVTERLVADERDRAAHAPAVRRARSTPSTSASPARSGNSPAQSRNSVVLPAPFGPASSTTSPVSTSRSAPASAGNRPSMQTADRRRTQRNQSSGDRGCGTGEAYGAGRRKRRTGPTTARRRRDHGRYDRRRAPCDRGHRPDAGDPRTADPAVRRVPAVGNRHLHRPRPGKPEERVPSRSSQQYDADNPVVAPADHEEARRSSPTTPTTFRHDKPSVPPADAGRRRRRGHHHDPERSASTWRSSRARRATT